MHCLQQGEPSRRLAGARLLSLLVDLTSIVYFDAAAFTNAVFARLIAQDGLAFSDFLSILPDSLAAATFRLALCRKFLATSSSVDSARIPSASKPQNRIQPRARRRGGQTGEDVPQNPKPAETNAAPDIIVSKFALPPSKEILQLVQRPHDRRIQGSALELSKVKFDMVLTYGKLQGGLPYEDRDADWPKILQDGTLRESVDSVIGTRHGETDQQAESCLCMKQAVLSVLGA
ncbi:hypothetical protein OE88DRAFT_1654801 [Heliocybe sulcata]|uniref:Uncharacterized protein n=1 Tax=Heliocybe sulcata TaxID=5364 RepID=A0A5C3NDY3_9AGAM|nr:hypothetical protein OE88DRAFT_1654801 [Heliocybe sulcata]